MKYIDYIHCDTEQMKCFPQSKDCENEYKLTVEDLYTDSRCDFAERERIIISL